MTETNFSWHNKICRGTRKFGGSAPKRLHVATRLARL